MTALRKVLSQLTFCCLLTLPAFCQIEELNLGQQSYVPEKFTANWVTHPELGGGEQVLKISLEGYMLIIPQIV